MLLFEIIDMTQKDLKALKPYRVGRVRGHNFFECPINGDESPLLCEHAGVLCYSEFWELPQFFEVTPPEIVAG